MARGKKVQKFFTQVDDGSWHPIESIDAEFAATSAALTAAKSDPSFTSGKVYSVKVHVLGAEETVRIQVTEERVLAGQVAPIAEAVQDDLPWGGATPGEHAERLNLRKQLVDADGNPIPVQLEDERQDEAD